MRGCFITGTDTGVGKSVISASLTRALRGIGHDAVAIKPIETGCAGEPSDGALLMAASGNSEPIEAIVPLTFREPLAPMVAASLEGRTIEPRELVSKVRATASRHEFAIVEGAGGLLVPITKRYFMRDLMRDLELPVLIVASVRLGTLNHTLMTIECARNAGLSVAVVVLNENVPPDGGIAERTNPDVLRSLTDLPVIGPFPYMREPAQSTSFDFSALLAALGISGRR